MDLDRFADNSKSVDYTINSRTLRVRLENMASCLSPCMKDNAHCDPILALQLEHVLYPTPRFIS